jgi:prefoldin subunit 5
MPYCQTCGEYVPEGMPHSCGKVPFYTKPGLDESDRSVVYSIDKKTADALVSLNATILKLNESLTKLDNLDSQMLWAKNKLQNIGQDIDTLQASVDMLNEKIP